MPSTESVPHLNEFERTRGYTVRWMRPITVGDRDDEELGEEITWNDAG